MGKIIAVSNQKGGVGKTTTVINVCAGIAARGFRVLLVDLDPQGNATSGCGISKKKVVQSVYDAMANASKTPQCILYTATENMFIIPANGDLAGAEIEMVEVENREFLLKQALSTIKDKFDFIFIDCPPSLGMLTLNALNAADTVLIPIQCEYFALEGLSQLTNTVRLVRQRFNPKLEIEGVLLTMYDGRLNLCLQAAQEIKHYFEDKMYNIVIPRNVRLSEAPSHGMSVLQYDRTCKGAAAYDAVAVEFLKRNGRI